MHRAVFLDRDGVITAHVYNPEFGTVDSPANPEELLILPGVAEAIGHLRKLGLLVIVVSNQPGVAKRRFTRRLLDAMTDKMTSALEAGGGRLDAVYCCLHHTQSAVPEYRVDCDCRKPKPGLLLQAAQEWNVELERSYMVGDGVTDMLAGAAVKATTVFVNSRKCYLCEELQRQSARPHYWVANLMEAAALIEQVERRSASSEQPLDTFSCWK